MNIKTRRWIFYTLVALFIVIGGGVVFYAQGWRFDVGTLRFEKIGGIYVRAYPEYASIFLNGKPVQNQSGFLNSGTLISDLLPRPYAVTLKAPGYDMWQENATVAPSLVVQFKYAILVPATGTLAVPSTTLRVALANAASQAAATTSTNPYNTNQKVVFTKNKLSLFDIATATMTQSVAISGNNIVTTWISGNIVSILQVDGELYLYDTNAQTLTKLADDVKNFAVTADGSMVAALEHHSLEIFSLADSSIYYRFNLPNVDVATRVIWYRDRSHLFVVYSDHVSFLDLTDSGLTNFITVANGVSPLYDPNTNSLYLKTSINQYSRYNFPT